MIQKFLSKTKVIGFDLDGTLIDSLDLHYSLLIAAAKENGVLIAASDIARNQGMRAEFILKQVNNVISDKTVKTIVDKYYLELSKHLLVKDSIRPFPDAVSTLHTLGKHAKLVLLSNGHSSFVQKQLLVAGINPLLFDRIVGSDQVEHPKPWPDEALLAEKLEHHHLDYYVGDTVVDMRMSKNAGIKGIGVTTGIGKRDELEEEKPFKVIDHLHDLLEIVK